MSGPLRPPKDMWDVEDDEVSKNTNPFLDVVDDESIVFEGDEPFNEADYVGGVYRPEKPGLGQKLGAHYVHGLGKTISQAADFSFMPGISAMGNVLSDAFQEITGYETPKIPSGLDTAEVIAGKLGYKLPRPDRDEVDASLQPDTFLESVLTGAAEGAGEFGPFGFIGGVRGGLTKAASGVISESATGALFGTGKGAVKAAGGGPIAQLVGGIVALLSPKAAKVVMPKLVSGAKDVGNIVKEAIVKTEPLPEQLTFLENAQTPRAKAELYLLGDKAKVKTAAARIGRRQLEDFQSVVDAIPDGRYSEGIALGAESVPDLLTKQAVKTVQEELAAAALDRLSPSTTKEAAWSGIKDFSNKVYGKQRAAYSALFDAAERGAESIKAPMTNTLNHLNPLIKRTTKSLLRSPEESSVIDTMKSFRDALKSDRSVEAKRLMKTFEDQGLDKHYSDVLKTLESLGRGKRVSVDRMMATDRSLRRILSKSDIVPAPVDLLKGLLKEIDADITSALKNQPDILETRNAAMDLYKNTAETFQSKAIRRLLDSDTPQLTSDGFLDATNARRLLGVVEGNPEMTRLVEREIVEQIAQLNPTSQKMAMSELRSVLSTDAMATLQDIQALAKEGGNPLTSAASMARNSEAIFKNIIDSAAVGIRPKLALSAMDSPSGLRMIDGMLETSEQGRAIQQGLNKMKAEDLVSKIVTKSGEINYDAARSILKNPHTRSLVKRTMGKEGVEFFANMERYGKNLRTSLETLETMGQQDAVSGIADALSDSQGTSVAIMLSYISGIKAFAKAATATKAGKALYTGYQRAQAVKMLSDPEVQTIVKEISTNNLSVADVIALINQLKTLVPEDTNG